VLVGYERALDDVSTGCVDLLGASDAATMVARLKKKRCPPGAAIICAGLSQPENGGRPARSEDISGSPQRFF
jgi:hypothetical protein